MKVTGAVISLNVADPSASAEFLTRHVGHTVAMQADGFVSLSHPDGGPNVIYLRTGLPTFRPAHRAGSAGDGLLLVFVVDDVDAVYENVRAAGASVVTAPETEPWGERYCQFEDPNGIIVQFVTWV
ncbi:glyoxalase [Mycobacterium sp. Soil538]|nr:glyoxalase [Mycobacterium sp. Soil538]